MAKSASKKKGQLAKFILNCRPSKDVDKDWNVSAALAAGVLSPKQTVPAAKDLRDDTWWKIGNQGSTGSCVGWAAADGVLRWHFTIAKRLSKKETLSVRYVWMASKETDEFTSRPTSFIEQDGTSLKAALDVARLFGVVTEDVLPFENAPGAPQLFISPDPDDQNPENTFYALAAQRKIASYFNLGRDLAKWRAWIATNGPILTRLDVDATWDNATQTAGILDTYDPARIRGGHCVALVGYTSDHFIVRNSWDTSWGDKGYAYASNSYTAAAFTEAYGVTL
jgi:hypothetical protein